MKQLWHKPFKQILVPATILPLLLPSLIVIGLMLTRPVQVQGSAAGAVTIVKEADPADGTNFVFTTDALPITPTFALAWGSEGSNDGQFTSPYGLAVDAAGSVYVADTSNHRIQKFDGDGSFQLILGSEGSGNGQFSYPQGVMVDTAGNIYVSETGNDRIRMCSD